MPSFWSSLVARLTVLRQLHSLGDIILFLQIFLFAAFVPLLVYVKPRRLESLLGSKQTGVAAEPVRIQKITGYVEGVRKIGNPLISPGCLTRTLTLYHFLSQSGLDLAVCFGIGQVQGEFIGHCWLIQNGEPFLEKKDPRPLFKQTYRFPDPVTPVADLSQALNPPSGT